MNESFNINNKVDSKEKIVKSSNKIKKIIYASLAVLGLMGSFESKAQNLEKNFKGNITEESTKKIFDNNYIIKPDLKRWIHWVKTEDFITYGNEKSIEKIKDVSEEEMKKVYTYLETIMNVWDYRSLDEFGVKLRFAEEALSRKESLEDKIITPVSLTSEMFRKYLDPKFQGDIDKEIQDKLNQDAINLAIEIKKILSH